MRYIAITVFMAGIVQNYGCGGCNEHKGGSDVADGWMSDLTVQDPDSAIEPDESKEDAYDGAADFDTVDVSHFDDVDGDVADCAEVLEVSSDDGVVASVDAAVLCSRALPFPGDTCSVKGASRCTNVDAVAEFLNFGSGDLEGWICHRPHKVVCRMSREGVLEWTLEMCPLLIDGEPCESGSGAHISSCQEGDRGSNCCPAGCTPTKVGYGTQPVMCEPGDRGKRLCQGSMVLRCGYMDDVSGDEDIDDLMGEAFSECGSLCAGCTYWFVERFCEPVKCEFPPDDPYREAVCIDDDDGVRCGGTEVCLW